MDKGSLVWLWDSNEDALELSGPEFKGLLCVFSTRKHSCLGSGME